MKMPEIGSNNFIIHSENGYHSTVNCITYIPAKSPKFFVMFTNLGLFYNFKNVASSFMKNYSCLRKCIARQSPYLPLQVMMVKGCKRDTHFKEVYTNKFLKQVKLATAQ